MGALGILQEKSDGKDVEQSKNTSENIDFDYEPLADEGLKMKCRFVTKCCLLGTVSGLLIIFALSISGFFAFKIFNERKEDCYVNVSGELNPKENLAFFPSTEKMNWFEANRFCYEEGGELVTIMDNSKLHKVKKFMKNLAWVVDESTPILYDTIRETKVTYGTMINNIKNNASNFWIGLYDRDFTEKKSLVRESDGPSLDGPEAEVTTWKTEPVEELEGAYDKFLSNGCVANAYYGWQQNYDWGQLIYGIRTYWYNDDCYAKHFALCQKKVADEFNPHDCDYNYFFNWTKGNMGLMCGTLTGYVE